MDTVKVYVGKTQSSHSGIVQDDTTLVEFVAEQRATLRQFGEHKGNLSDTRGTDYTLYEVEDGRLIVYVETWSRWQGEGDQFDLFAVDIEDLQPGGRFADIGAEAGYGRPLTLDEALGAN